MYLLKKQWAIKPTVNKEITLINVFDRVFLSADDMISVLVLSLADSM